MAQALYSKYRPKVFNDVVGQKQTLQTLKNAITSDKISHAYLFCGPRGTGKTTMARLLAKACMCEKAASENKPVVDFCGTCESCQDIAAGQHPDVYELDAASRTGVENVREEIISRVGFAATRGNKKIYIIDEVHMLSTAAFNALLKTLEEPPEHVIFILCTTDPQKVPETIISRCQRFDFQSISAEDIVERLNFVCEQEGVTAQPDALKIIAQKANGAMRNALTQLEQLISFTNGEITADLVKQNFAGDDQYDYPALIESLGVKNLPIIFEWVQSACEKGADFGKITEKLTLIIRDMYIASVGAKASVDYQDIIDKYIGLFTTEKLHHMMLILSDLSTEFKISSNLRLSFEIAMAKIANPASEFTVEALASRISALEAGQPKVATPAPAAKETPAPIAVPAINPTVAASSAPAAKETPAEISIPEIEEAPKVSAAPKVTVPPAVAPIPEINPASVSKAGPAANPTPATNPVPAAKPQPPEAKKTNIADEQPFSAIDEEGSPFQDTEQNKQTTPVDNSKYQPLPEVDQNKPETANVQDKNTGIPNFQVPERPKPINFGQERQKLRKAANIQDPAPVDNKQQEEEEEFDIQKMWHKAFSNIRKKYPAFGATLLTANVSHDPLMNKLTLTFPASSSFSVGVLRKPDNMAKIDQEVKQAIDPNMSFDIAIDDAGAVGFTPKFNNNFRNAAGVPQTNPGIKKPVSSPVKKCVVGNPAASGVVGSPAASGVVGRPPIGNMPANPVANPAASGVVGGAAVNNAVPNPATGFTGNSTINAQDDSPFANPVPSTAGGSTLPPVNSPETTVPGIKDSGLQVDSANSSASQPEDDVPNTAAEMSQFLREKLRESVLATETDPFNTSSQPAVNTFSNTPAPGNNEQSTPQSDLAQLLGDNGAYNITEN